MTDFLNAMRIFRAEPDAANWASDLFRQSFSSPFPLPKENCGLSIPTPPENWRQYVAVYSWPGGKSETVGFCNWIRHGEVYLEGGLCVAKDFYRRLPRDHFLECKKMGGIAQMMTEKAATELNDCLAWFGYCGDAKAMAVNLRVGYEATAFKHLIVKWFATLCPEERSRLVEEIAKVGPF